MKIVDRETFLSLPKNTVYCGYHPIDRFGNICIKTSGENAWPNDWEYSELTGWIAEADDSAQFYRILEAAKDGGREFRFDLDSTIRDGVYDGGMFAIFDKDDILAVIKKLRTVLKKIKTP